MLTSKTIEYLKLKICFQSSDQNAIEREAIRSIIATPFSCVDKPAVASLVGDNYVPGLFYMHERAQSPSFLFDENKVSYEQWLYNKLKSELEQLLPSPELAPIIHCLGMEQIIEFAMSILEFDTDNNLPFGLTIINQEYSDIFRRVLVYILVGNPFYIYCNHLDFNRLGKEIATLLIQQQNGLSLRESLYTSIASGLIGIDIKDSRINTNPISLKSTVRLSGNINISEMQSKLAWLSRKDNVGIDDFDLYENEVIKGSGLTISWVTDDYIATMFELKFIQNQMLANRTLSFNIIPRYDSYSNDASYMDVIDMLELPIFGVLKKERISGRLKVIRNGMDISTIDASRLSLEAFQAINDCNILVVSGARAFEMVQGINKITYYTGLAVCKSYSESITGFAKESGKLIFMRQSPGTKCFYGFKARAWRKMVDGNSTIAVAAQTAREVHSRSLINSYEPSGQAGHSNR